MGFRQTLTGIGIAALMASSSTLWAQEAKPDGTAPEKEAKASEEAAAPASEEASRPLTGDVITFNNGKVLSSVQVLRATPKTVVVQMLPNLPPMEFPRKQVKNIQYDNIDPNKVQEAPPAASAALPDIIVGENMAPDFHRKLTGNIDAEQDLAFENVDCVEMLRKISEKLGVVLEVAKPVTDMPPAQRIRSFTIKAKTSFWTFLKDDFSAAFPKLKVLYKFDKIVLTTQEEAAKETPNPPAAEAPLPPPAEAPPAKTEAPPAAAAL